MSYIDTDSIINKYAEHDVNTVKEMFRYYMNQGRRNGKTNGDYYRHLPLIKKVIFNDPATIVIWDDGTKTVVKRSDKDEWDPEKGLAMAIVRKLFTRNQFLKIIPKEAWEGEDYALEH